MASISNSVHRAEGLRIGFAFNLKPANDEPAPSDVATLRSNSPLSRAEVGDRPAVRDEEPYADEYAEWDEESTIEAVAAALSQVGEVVRLEADADFPERLRAAEPDIVFNLAEGRGGRSRESYVPAFCEFWGIPYTGSDPLALGLCLDKARTKESLSHYGIPTPDFQVVESPDRLRQSMDLPVIVKPLHEGSSKGIRQGSVCTEWAEVTERVAEIVARYGQPALVERFLAGREFTVALLGNDGDGRALPLVELDFATLPAEQYPVYGFEAKWIWDQLDDPLAIFRCPAPCSPELESDIEEIAMAAFKQLGCRDWARVDVRCDERGAPHVLEINPLPGVLPDPRSNSCYPKAARAAGLSFDEMIVAVLRAAAARYGIEVEV